MSSLIDLNCDLCRALGVDPKDAVAVTLRLRTDRLPKVTVVYYVREQRSEVTKRFELVPQEKVMT
jgi:hypothetical protein